VKRDCKHKPTCFEKPEERSKSVSQADFQKLRDSVLQLAHKSPDKAAIILTAWINRQTSQKTKKAA
jgi:hypothetical protein